MLRVKDHHKVPQVEFHMRKIKPEFWKYRSSRGKARTSSFKQRRGANAHVHSKKRTVLIGNELTESRTFDVVARVALPVTPDEWTIRVWNDSEK